MGRVSQCPCSASPKQELGTHSKKGMHLGTGREDSGKAAGLQRNHIYSEVTHRPTTQGPSFKLNYETLRQDI